MQIYGNGVITPMGNTRVFIDVDNVHKEAAVETYRKLIAECRVSFCDFVGLPMALSDEIRRLATTDKRVHVVESDVGKKNSADTWLTMLATHAILTETNLSHLVIVSSDKDFVPVVWLAQRYGIKVTVIAKEGMEKGIENSIKEMSVGVSGDVKVVTIDKKKVVTAEEILEPLDNSIINYFINKGWVGEYLSLNMNGTEYQIPYVDGCKWGIMLKVLSSTDLLSWSNDKEKDAEFLAEIMGLRMNEDRELV